VLRLTGGGGSSSEEEDWLLASITTEELDKAKKPHCSEDEDEDREWLEAAILFEKRQREEFSARSTGSAGPDSVSISRRPSHPPETGDEVDLEGEEVLRERELEEVDEERAWEDVRDKEEELRSKVEGEFFKLHGWGHARHVEEFFDHFDMKKLKYEQFDLAYGKRRSDRNRRQAAHYAPYPPTPGRLCQPNTALASSEVGKESGQLICRRFSAIRPLWTNTGLLVPPAVARDVWTQGWVEGQLCLSAIPP